MCVVCVCVVTKGKVSQVSRRVGEFDSCTDLIYEHLLGACASRVHVHASFVALGQAVILTLAALVANVCTQD